MSDFGSKIAQEATRMNFDGVVAPAGGDYVTIQAADDALDAAAYSLLVRTGTYVGFTVATNENYIYVGPGTIVTSAIVISGNDNTLVFAPGCDIQGLITLGAGTNNHLHFQNACDCDGILLSGNYSYVNGGGWDTLSDGGAAVDAIQITGTDCIIENIATQTTAGGGNNLDGVSIEASRNSLKKVKVVNSDSQGIFVLGAGSVVEGCIIMNSDGVAIVIGGGRTKAIGNLVVASGSIGLSISSSGDNSVAMGNVIQACTGVEVDVHANAENCVVVANRVFGTINDDSLTSMVKDNELGTASAAITGTCADPTCNESDIVAGGETIIITLTNAVWVNPLTGGEAGEVRDDITDGIVSAQSEGAGWNARRAVIMPVGSVIRTSDTVVTVTLVADGAYAITANETITVTVPVAALASESGALTGAPTFDVINGA